uniref:Uncharacterized protein n=1 Tax=Schizaphis graminum TaxID=13262 RepID=A0A2S2PQ39_SCHGA
MKTVRKMLYYFINVKEHNFQFHVTCVSYLIICVGGKYNEVIQHNSGYVNNNDTVIIYYGVYVLMYYVLFNNTYFSNNILLKNIKDSLYDQIIFKKRNYLRIYIYL